MISLNACDKSLIVTQNSLRQSAAGIDQIVHQFMFSEFSFSSLYLLLYGVLQLQIPFIPSFKAGSRESVRVMPATLVLLYLESKGFSRNPYKAFSKLSLFGPNINCKSLGIGEWNYHNQLQLRTIIIHDPSVGVGSMDTLNKSRLSHQGKKGNGYKIGYLISVIKVCSIFLMIHQCS